MSIDEVLLHFKNLRRTGNSWSAQCPAHDDRTPSVTIREVNGKILVYCHAGCPFERVIEAAGLNMDDLFPDSQQPRIASTYDYTDETGKLLFQVLRYDPKDFRQRRPDGKGGWSWNLNGVRRVLYRLPEVLKAKTVLAVEGEKDCEAARKMGIVATCNPGGAGKWRNEYSECLRGKRVVIIADADEPGRKHAQQVAASLAGNAESLKVIELRGAKDLSEWVERGGTRDALEGFIESQREWNSQPSASVSLITRAFSDIKPEALRWLWPNRIPRGQLILLVGDPGLGKSLLTLDIASRVTRGQPFPDGAVCESGAVIMASAEDDPADTIRPRLDAAKADPSRVHLLEGVRVNQNNGSGSERPFQLGIGIAALEEALVRMPDVRLIVIDPISAYLGNTDSNSNAEIRGLLSPLANLAARHRVAVLCVTHLRKSAGTAVHRAIASIAFTAAARASWAVAADPSDPERRLMLAVKQNLGPAIGGLAFRITTENGLPRLNWDKGAVNLTADDVFGNVVGRDEEDAQHQAESWLQTTLAKGPVPPKEIEARAKSAGLSWATVRRAKEALGVVAEKSGYQGGWRWRLKDAHGEGAQTPDAQTSAFDQGTENTPDTSLDEDEGAQEISMGTFERGEF
jgi:5S rRNA maturation endonuclease (ribonuclease M5)